MRNFLRLLRVRSWVKNIFVFSGLFFSTRMVDGSLTRAALIIFAQFCALASAVYCFNDLHDREADSRHPQKKLRPIPSGQVSVSQAWFLILGLLAITAILCFFESRSIPLLVTYLLINIAYTLKLKDIVILDVTLISFGFLLRILIGTYPLGIQPSHWLLFCGFSLTFFISLSKRYLEYTLHAGSGNQTRKVLEQYNLDFLKLALGAIFAQTLIGYSLYISESGSKWVYLSLFPVLYGMLSYLLIISKERINDDPVRIITTSKEIIIAGVIWASLFVANLYA